VEHIWGGFEHYWVEVVEEDCLVVCEAAKEEDCLIFVRGAEEEEECFVVWVVVEEEDCFVVGKTEEDYRVVGEADEALEGYERVDGSLLAFWFAKEIADG
jgi:hypothetical protein